MLPAMEFSLEWGMIEEAANADAEDLGLLENLIRASQHPENAWVITSRLFVSGESRGYYH